MSEEVGDHEFEEVADVIPVMKVVECPKCKSMVPYSMYCTCCEYPLHTFEDGVDGIEDERLDAIEDGIDEIEDERLDAIEEGIDRIEDGSVDLEIIKVDTRLDVKNAEQHPSEPSIQFENVDEDFDKADSRSNFEFESEILPKPQITGKLDPEEGGELDDSYDEEEDESVGIHEVMPSDVISDEPTAADSVSGDEEGPTSEFSPNQSILELNRDIINCISLKLWSVNLLLEGKIDEAQFNELYEGYYTRYQQGMDRRTALLEQPQDLETVENLLMQARVSLEELEKRKSLDDLCHGEYEAKVPAYIWDIQHYIDTAYARSMEIAYLKDLTKVISADEIAGMKEMTEKLLHILDNLEFTENVNDETLASVRRSLEEIIAFIEDN